MALISTNDSPMCIHCLKQVRECDCKLDGWPGVLRAEVKQRPKSPAPFGLLERFVICVRHRDGWCATKREKGLQYHDNVPTLCGAAVTMPWGIERRVPDCQECLAIIGR